MIAERAAPLGLTMRDMRQLPAIIAQERAAIRRLEAALSGNGEAETRLAAQRAAVSRARERLHALRSEVRGAAAEASSPGRIRSPRRRRRASPPRGSLDCDGDLLWSGSVLAEGVC